MKTITTNKSFFASLILLLNAATAPADTMAPFANVRGETCFAAHEPTLDIYGTVRDNWHLGIGAGANYFLTPWLGGGVETRFEKFDWPNEMSASLIARYPLEQWRLAPYAYGGGGRQFRDGAQWLAHIGIGLDYRVWPRIGLFGDVRETFAEKSRNFALWRLGVRLRF